MASVSSNESENNEEKLQECQCHEAGLEVAIKDDFATINSV